VSAVLDGPGAHAAWTALRRVASHTGSSPPEPRPASRSGHRPGRGTCCAAVAAWRLVSSVRVWMSLPNRRSPRGCGRDATSPTLSARPGRGRSARAPALGSRRRSTTAGRRPGRQRRAPGRHGRPCRPTGPRDTRRRYRVRLPVGRRHEQRGARYGVIVQADALLGLSTVLIAPTSRSAAPATFRPEVQFAGELTRVLVEQLRTVDLDQFGRQAGRLAGRAASGRRGAGAGPRGSCAIAGGQPPLRRAPPSRASAAARTPHRASDSAWPPRRCPSGGSRRRTSITTLASARQSSHGASSS
jgi:mRNA interferase MazF